MVLNLSKYHEVVKHELRAKIEELYKKELWILTDGVDEKCKSYMKSKVQIGKELGIDTKVITIKDNIHFENVLTNAIVGRIPVILQLPINKRYEDKYSKIKNMVKAVDVDGFFRFQEVANGDYSIAPATPKGILNYLKNGLHMDLGGKTITVVGRGNLVGKPLALMMMNEGASVTSINSKTDVEFRASVLKHSDVVILATGVKGSVKVSELSRNTIVVNVGTCFDDSGKLTTELDVDMDIKDIELANIRYTPRIKGVGILTVLSLFDNVVNFYNENGK